MFIGDSDRMSHFLTWLIHLNDGVRGGHLPTWNNSLFGGYSTAGLPYVYYNPLAFSGLLFPPELQNWVAGWVSMLWLFASGVAVYFLIKTITSKTLYAFTGAALYLSSAAPILKISQNDGTFSVAVMAPIVLLCMLSAKKGRMFLCMLGSFLALTYLLSISFLQEAAYAGLLLSTFGLYRLVFRRDVKPFLVLLGSGLAAICVSFPRLVNVGMELSLSNRGGTSGFLDTWAGLGAFNRLEIFRWLDDRFFGQFYSHSLSLGNGLNMHEGMLAYASTFAVVIFFVGIFAHLRNKRTFGESGDITFHSLFWVFCLCVVVTKTGYWIMYYLFLKIGFIHARITTIGTLSFCILVAIFLNKLDEKAIGDSNTNTKTEVAHFAIIAAVCVLVTFVLESSVAPFVNDRVAVKIGGFSAFASKAAVLRVILSIAIAAVLLSVIYRGGNGLIRKAAVPMLAILSVMQVAVYAKDQTSGEFMRREAPFKTPTRLLADGNQFKVPSASAKADIRRNLEAEDYRVTLMCDPAQIGIYCNPYMANVWGLREIGGYVSAIPIRISALPWSEGQVGLRSVTTESVKGISWDLLALLNVKYAVEYHPGLLTNAIRDKESNAVRELRPDDLVIHRNPLPTVPRVFLAARVDSVDSMEKAAGILFPGKKYDAAKNNVLARSVAESGKALGGDFSTEGTITSSFRDQHIEVRLPPSGQRRFLVINERYHPGWAATIDGNLAEIYPTNVFMRGLVVPPGATTVKLEYRPFSFTPRAGWFYGAGIVILALLLYFTIRFDRSESETHGKR